MLFSLPMPQVVDRNQILLVNETLSFLLDNQVGLCDADHKFILAILLRYQVNLRQADSYAIWIKTNDAALKMDLKDVKTLNEGLKDGVKEYVANKTGEPVMDVLHFYCSHLVKLKLMSQKKCDDLMKEPNGHDFMFNCKVFLDMCEKGMDASMKFTGETLVSLKRLVQSVLLWLTDKVITVKN